MTTLDKKPLDFPFYCVLLLVLVEYVRPQSIIPAIGYLHPGWIVYSLLFFNLIIKQQLLNFSDIQIKLMLALLLLISIGTYFASNNYVAYHVWRGMLLNTIAVMSIVRFVNSYAKILTFLNVLLFSFILSGIVGTAFGGHIPGSGFMQDENDFSLVMNMAVPFAYFLLLETQVRSRKWLYLICIGVFVSATALSFSRGGFVGLVTVASYCWYKSPRKKLAIAVFLLLAFTLVVVAPSKYWDEMGTIKEENIETGTGADRWFYWTLALRIFRDHPIIGVGPGNYYTVAHRYQTLEERRQFGHLWGTVAHSLYFTLISELGSIGVIIFSLMLIYCRRQTKFILNISNGSSSSGSMEEEHFELRKMTSITCGIFGSSIGYLVSGLFLSVLYYPHFWIIIAFTTVVFNYTKEIIAINNINNFDRNSQIK